jgi:hypothetical protein
MSYVIAEYTGDAVTTDFAFSFSYLDEAYVTFKVTDTLGADVSNSYIGTVINSTTLQITPAPDTGFTVQVKRETTVGDEIFQWAAGAIIRPADLGFSMKTLRDFAEEKVAEAQSAVDLLNEGAALETVAGLSDELAAVAAVAADISVLVEENLSFAAMPDTNLSAIAEGDLVKFDVNGHLINFTPTYISSYTETSTLNDVLTRGAISALDVQVKNMTLTGSARPNAQELGADPASPDIDVSTENVATMSVTTDATVTITGASSSTIGAQCTLIFDGSSAGADRAITLNPGPGITLKAPDSDLTPVLTNGNVMIVAGIVLNATTILVSTQQVT